jgi:antirestriction protein ArdC
MVRAKETHLCCLCGSFAFAHFLEELVAEITSTCILHDKGIATTATDKNSMAYVQGWAKALRSDPTMVEKACKLAIKATNFIYSGKKNND